MASVSQYGQKFSVRFRYNGKNHRVTVESQKKAESVRLIVENTLTDLRLHRLTIPEGVDVAEFIASGGKTRPVQKTVCLSDLIDDWQTHRVAAHSTKYRDESRCKHLREHLGAQRVDQLDLQGYIEARTPFVSGKSIRKELVCLSAILRHGKASGIVCTALSLRSLKFPPSGPDRRFTTLDNASDGRLILLDSSEVTELREVVQAQGSELISDAVEFVAFTGVRRSEVTRVQAQDIDLKGLTVTIRELKRKHGQMTFRSVPIHPSLVPVLKRRMKRGSVVFTESVNTLSAGLSEAIAGTKFDVKGFGFHVLRHSAASRLLAQGVSPVTVAAILGHGLCL